jgi:hypothetical protein
LLTWLARNADDSAARRAIIWDLFVYDAIGLAATLAIQLKGGLNALGWGVVFVYLFFTVGFGCFLVPEGRPRPAAWKSWSHRTGVTTMKSDRNHLLKEEVLCSDDCKPPRWRSHGCW